MSNEKSLLLQHIRGVINFLLVNWQKHHFGVWAVVYKREQKIISHCGFKFLENTAEIQIGYLLRQAYWGRGLATEAAEAALPFGFEVAKSERIVAIIKPENIASIRVMKKLEMNYEKYSYYYNNNVVYYSMAREDYLSNTRLSTIQKNRKKSLLCL
jgi:ribosomal-protein-alanine N-acetyltransferase